MLYAADVDKQEIIKRTVFRFEQLIHFPSFLKLQEFVNYSFCLITRRNLYSLKQTIPLQDIHLSKSSIHQSPEK
jgi:hypothetical protein